MATAKVIKMKFLRFMLSKSYSVRFPPDNEKPKPVAGMICVLAKPGLMEMPAPVSPHSMNAPYAYLKNFRSLSLAAAVVVAMYLSGCAGGGETAPRPISQEDYPIRQPAPPVLGPGPVTPPQPVPLPAPTPAPTPAAARVSLGIDVLAAQNFAILKGQRVGLLTHPAGVNRDGVSTVDILRRAPNVNLVALFGPEHGIYGDEKAGMYVPDGKDIKTGLPVYSLYGANRTPSSEMLKNVDVMVVDLQDIGSRSYTFISCLRLTMEACFTLHKTVVVLDRPNPLGGLKVGGPMSRDNLISYVGAYPVPYVFGLTIGELAQMTLDNPGWLQVTDEIRLSALVNHRLIIVPMNGWRRSMTWQDTGLKWVPTSPNIPSAAAAFGYAMTGLVGVDGIPTKFSFGIGSEYPFRFLNYPGRKPAELAATLTALNLAGLKFTPYTYLDPKTKVERSGVYLGITDWNAVNPTRLAFEMMKLDAAWNPGDATWKRGDNAYMHITGSGADLFEKLIAEKPTSPKLWLKEISTKGKNADVNAFFREWDAQDTAFQQRSQRWWIYPK